VLLERHSSHGLDSIPFLITMRSQYGIIIFLFFFLQIFQLCAYAPHLPHTFSHSREPSGTRIVSFRRPRDSCRPPKAARSSFPANVNRQRINSGVALRVRSHRIRIIRCEIGLPAARLARYNSCRDRGICMRRPLNGARITDSRDDENAAERLISAMR